MDASELESSFRALHIPKTHVTVGLTNLVAHDKQFRALFLNRRLPDCGWSDVQIQLILLTLSTLDTNNKSNTSPESDSGRWCGVGEREGRVYSSLVQHRHFGMAHGIGRSGDIVEPQPKAVGSSVLARLTLLMALDAVRRGSGLAKDTAAAHGILLPLCTGMSMALVLSSLRKQGKDIVLWSRIDQKSCFKAVISSGYQCIVVPTKLEGDAVVTDMDAMRQALDQYQDRVIAIITTTSCFAPRVPDQVDNVAQLCQERNVHHIINNAYGLQSKATSKLINRACVIGRVDAIVCSTDKNFLVPVGGALVLSPQQVAVEDVGKIYAGRASASPIVDLFITLLSMGLNGYQRMLDQRQNLQASFPDRFHAIAQKHGERLLICTRNEISFGITLDGLVRSPNEGENVEDYERAVSSEISSLGAMLFSRCVSGTRVVAKGSTKSMGETLFKGFGSSHDAYPHSYLTAACAIGVTEAEIDEFLVRLDKTLKEFTRKQQRKLISKDP